MTTTTSSPSAGTRVERPATVPEVADLLRDAGGSVLVRGGGTKMRWGGVPAVPDLELATGALDRLVEHTPADMTAVVQGGLPLRTLQEALAEHGQWLALDPPTEAAGASVGGLLASGDSGPRRLRYGAMRDLVIGVTLVLADGTVAHAGGRVIKNVAGYDLSKLVYGSLGSLAVIAEVVVRVHPRPAARATLVAPASLAVAQQATLQLMASTLEPSAIQWAGPVGGGTEPGRLAVRFDGSAAGVTASVAAARTMLTGSGASPEELSEVDSDAFWSQSAGVESAGVESAGAGSAASEQSVVAAGTLPSDLGLAADALARAADAAEITATLISQSALGLHTARLAGPPEAQARVVDDWRAAVLAVGGSVLLRDRPPEVDAYVDPLGPPPSAVAVLRAVKARLDPQGRLARGRFGSWY